MVLPVMTVFNEHYGERAHTPMLFPSFFLLSPFPRLECVVAPFLYVHFVLRRQLVGPLEAGRGPGFIPIAAGRLEDSHEPGCREPWSGILCKGAALKHG